MQLITITLFALANRLVSLAIAKPVPKSKAGGISVPLSRQSSFLDSNKTVDLDAINSHGIFVREKILSGLENYEKNTGTMHPFAAKRTESGLAERGPRLPLVPTSQGNTWMCEISIGTPPQTLKVSIDTAAADMWVLETDCDGISGDRNLWDPLLSHTSENTGEPFRLQYSLATIVQGDEFTDNVTLSGFTADHHNFGSVTSYQGPVQNNGNSDGSLGFAFPSISQFEDEPNPLFVSLLMEEKIVSPTFSLKLSSSGAEMYVGGANSMLYNGDITYIPVIHAGFWLVNMDDVRVDGHPILGNVPAILDTGSNFIYGDRLRVKTLYDHIGGTLMQHGAFGYYYLPCDSFPTLSLTLGGRSFKIPPEALRSLPVTENSPNCFSTIVAQPSAGSVGYWTIGHPFLQGVYSVFDYGTLQVGFADLT